MRIRRITLWLLILAVPALLAAQTASLQQAWSLTDRARELARSPQPQDSLALYEEALRLAPEEWTIERDYGVGQPMCCAVYDRLIRISRPGLVAKWRMQSSLEENHLTRLTSTKVLSMRATSERRF